MLCLPIAAPLPDVYDLERLLAAEHKFDANLVSLLRGLLHFNDLYRLSAKEACRHPYCENVHLFDGLT